MDDTAVVVGSGMIGLLVVQALRLAGCGRVIAVDLDEKRLRLAGELGAEVCINARNHDVPSVVRDCTSGRGSDVAVEVAGNSFADSPRESPQGRDADFDRQHLAEG